MAIINLKCKKLKNRWVLTYQNETNEISLYTSNFNKYLDFLSLDFFKPKDYIELDVSINSFDFSETAPFLMLIETECRSSFGMYYVNTILGKIDSVFINSQILDFLKDYYQTTCWPDTIFIQIH